MEESLDCGRSVGERAADRFATLVGSWTFLISQTVLLAAWMGLNLAAWRFHWDPYPFILLNLVLSFQAAYAGPITMMSQNRQARVADLRNKLGGEFKGDRRIFARMRRKKMGSKADANRRSSIETQTLTRLD